ncbi:uncharacterized protein LOC111327866 [Stylophora pistillata]|nr:uncharacterized protein LOC111327866 [Stylophora pistillata]
MNLGFFVAIIAVLSLWNTADANSDELLDVKIRNRKFRLTESEVREMLKTAALEKHGFKVKVTTKVVKDLESGEQHCQTSYQYHKEVDCSRMQRVGKQLNDRIPGAFEREMTLKTREAIQNRGLYKMGKCQFGLAIDIKKDEGCFGVQKDTEKATLKRFNKQDRSSFAKVSVEIKNVI